MRTVVSILRGQTSGTRLSTSAFALAAFLPLIALYLITTDKAFPHHGDAYTNAVTAWSLGTQSTFVVPQLEATDYEAGFGRAYWFVATDAGPVSKYPPGAALLAAPAYAITRPSSTVGVGSAGLEGADPAFAGQVVYVPIWQASAVAALATALGMTALALAGRDLVGDRVALLGAYAGGLGTTAWSVAADGLWQHGPAILWIGLAILAMSHERFVLSGTAFGLAILTRPQVAAIAAVAGLVSAVGARSWKRLVAVGAPAAAGLGAYLAYNHLVFGELLPRDSGAYFVESATSKAIADWVFGILRAAFDPGRGFLVWSPFLLLLLPGLARAWRRAPTWVRGAALGGAVYFVIQMRGNLWSGGVGHFTYRYPLEMLAASAPLLLLSYQEWVQSHRLRETLFRFATAASAAAHGAGAWL